MFETLVKRYGPEPDDDVPASPSETASKSPKRSSDYRGRLTKFYEKYAPDKLSQIDKALDVYKGKEDAMFETLVKRYGPEPDDDAPESPSETVSKSPVVEVMLDAGNKPNETSVVPIMDGLIVNAEALSALVKLFSVYAPERQRHLPLLLKSYHGREDELLPLVAADFGVTYIEESNSNSSSQMDSSFSASYPLPSSRGTICSAGNLSLQIHGGLQVLVAPDSSAEDKGDVHRLTVAVRFGRSDVFQTPPFLCSNRSGNINSTFQAPGNRFLLKLDGSTFLFKLVAYCDGKFMGECKIPLSALPVRGTVAFPLNVREGETDPFLIRQAASLGVIRLSWSFVSDAAVQTYRRIRNELFLAKTPEISSAVTRDKVQAPERSKHADVFFERIVAMHCRYLPMKVNRDDLLRLRMEYLGREEQLLDTMVVKYGPEPEPNSFRSRLERLFFHYDVGRVVEAHRFAVSALGQEEKVLRSLTTSLGPEIPVLYAPLPNNARASNAMGDRHRVRLTRWLSLRCPRRVEEVDYLLVRFSERETLLFRTLSEVLGAEPADDVYHETLRSRHSITGAIGAYFRHRRAPGFLQWVWSDTTSTQANLETENATSPSGKPTPAIESAFSSQWVKLRHRLERFYRFYNPIKASTVEETLQEWRGREELLFEALRQKYGPEPATTARERDVSYDVRSHKVQDVPTNSTSSSAAETKSSVLYPSPFRSTTVLQPPGIVTLSASKQTKKKGGGGQDTIMMSSVDVAEKLERYFSKWNPAQISQIGLIVERFDGRYSELDTMLTTKYGSSLFDIGDEVSKEGNADTFTSTSPQKGILKS